MQYSLENHHWKYNISQGVLETFFFCSFMASINSQKNQMVWPSQTTLNLTDSQVTMRIGVQVAPFCLMWSSATASMRWTGCSPANHLVLLQDLKCIMSLSTGRHCMLFNKILQFKSASHGFFFIKLTKVEKEVVLSTSLLNIQQYNVQIKGKWSNLRKGVATFPTPRCSSYWNESLWVALDYRQPNYLLMVDQPLWVI